MILPLYTLVTGTFHTSYSKSWLLKFTKPVYVQPRVASTGGLEIILDCYTQKSCSEWSPNTDVGYLLKDNGMLLLIYFVRKYNNGGQVISISISELCDLQSDHNDAGHIMNASKLQTLTARCEWMILFSACSLMNHCVIVTLVFFRTKVYTTCGSGLQFLMPALGRHRLQIIESVVISQLSSVCVH